MAVGLWAKMVGVAAIILIAGFVAMVVFGNIWARTGIGAAMLFVFGVIALLAWNVDRKDRAKRAGIEELPRV
jgi:Flp pilus assembly protein TadB